VRDENMLEKLATHDVQDVPELFSLVDKCTRTVEGCAWHSQPALEAGKAVKPETDAAAKSNDINRNRKKKAGDNNNNKPLARSPTTAVAAGGGHGPRGDKRPRYPFGSDESGPWCPVHNSRCHIAEECWEIKKLVE
jgi:hypothetical protein